MLSERMAMKLVAAGALVLLPAFALAQGAGKIVCWKDSAGKVIGCGDKVPLEYQGSGTKELDARGRTRAHTESAEEASRRREREQQAARGRAEDERKALEQRRQDVALLETYSNEKEIEAKRDRELQVIDLQIEQLAMALKNTGQRLSDVKSRVAPFEKSGKAPPPALKEELARASADKQRFEDSIAQREREKEALRNKYSDYQTRFRELRAQQTAASARK